MMSSDVKKTAALASLTATYSDSDESDDHEDNQQQEETNEDNGIEMNDNENDGIFAKRKILETESNTNSPASFISTSIEALKTNDALKKDNEENNDFYEDEYEERPSSPASYHKSLFGMNENQIVIPNECRDRCSRSLQEKVNRLYDKMRAGQDMMSMIQKRKDFRNPSIYEKLISYCGIDELATNYPPDIYDPHKWGPESYYDELSKRQKEEMEKKERERKEKTKVEFISGTKKTIIESNDNSSKKKSKWDIPVGLANTSGLPPSQLNIARPSIIIPVTAPSGTKPTVISAFGTIGKKK